MREKYTITFAGGTDKGLVRKNNQDFFYIPASDDSLKLAIVADGMGGYKGGDVASKLCTETIVQYFNSKYNRKIDIDELLAESASVANTAVFDYAHENEYLSGMGTTVVMCAFDNETVHILNIGDSRCYHIKSNYAVKQITYDHTLVNEYVRMGKITPHQAKNHMHRHVITRAVGTDIDVESDTFKIALKNDEYILMCSDGMYEYIDEDMISETIKSHKDIQTAVDTLIEMSKQSGGADNITVVIASRKKA